MCRLLEKDAIWDFDKACMKAFEELKSKLVSAPIMIFLDWNEPFGICVIQVTLLFEQFWVRGTTKFSWLSIMRVEH